LDFRRLVLADKPLVDAALEKLPPEISELTFTNLYCWQAKRRVRIGVKDSRGQGFEAIGAEGLVLLCEEEGRRFFLPPVCMCDAAGAARAMFEHARAVGFEPVMERVPETMADKLGKVEVKVEVEVEDG
jgi:hypothetical protein